MLKVKDAEIIYHMLMSLVYLQKSLAKKKLNIDENI